MTRVSDNRQLNDGVRMAPIIFICSMSIHSFPGNTTWDLFLMKQSMSFFIHVLVWG